MAKKRGKRKGANKRLRAQKQRDRLQQHREREAAQSPREIRKPYRPEFTELSRELFPHIGLRAGSLDAQKCVSGSSHKLKTVRVHDELCIESSPEQEAEWTRREADAKRETERKKKQVAPLYNKGPYQMITDISQVKDLGRK